MVHTCSSLSHSEIKTTDRINSIEIKSVSISVQMNWFAIKLCMRNRAVIRTPHAEEHQLNINVKSERVSKLHLYLYLYNNKDLDLSVFF